MSRVNDIYMALRGLISRAVVQSIDDTGATQAVLVQTHAGRTRSRVPVHFPFGFGSRAPLDGAVTSVVAAGGDHSDLIALPPANPSAARVGNLAEGETVLYDSYGQKVYLSGGKFVRIDAAQTMEVRVAGQQILVVDKDGAALTGTLRVSKDILCVGDVTADGTVTGKTDVLANGTSGHNHTHTSAKEGSQTSSPN